MSLNANKVKSTGGKTIPLMESDTYPARVVQVLDLGLQKQRPYKGEDKKPQYELNVTYEFTGEFLQDEDGNDLEDKPRWLSERFPFYPLSADKAKSTKRYNAIDPDGKVKGDWEKLVGAPCNVTVVESKPNAEGRTFNNIGAVSALSAKKAEKLGGLVNPPKVFSLDDPDMEVFMSLPEWLQDLIKNNLEYEGSKLEKAVAGYVEPESEEAPEVEVSDDGKEDPTETEGEW